MERISAWVEQLEMLMEAPADVAIALPAPTVADVVAALNQLPLAQQQALHGKLHSAHRKLVADLEGYDAQLASIRAEMVNNRARLRASLAYAAQQGGAQ